MMDDQKTPDFDTIRRHLANEDAIYLATQLLEAVADSTRFRILLALSVQELCVSELVELLGVSQSAVSHQLRLLKDRGLVSAERSGQRVYYALDDDHVHTLINTSIEHVSHIHHHACGHEDGTEHGKTL